MYPNCLHLKAELHSTAWIFHILFTHSSINEHMEYVYIFAIINNVWVYRYLFKSLQNSLGFIPRSRITGSYDKSIFNFWRILHPALHSGCTIYIPTSQPGTRVPISLHNFQHLLFSVCLVPLGTSQQKGCELASELGSEGDI